MKSWTWIILFSLSLTANETFDTYLKSCTKSNAKACFDAAKYISSYGHTFVKQNSNTIAAQSAQLYKKSCNLGLAKACTAYGMIFYADPLADATKNDLYFFKKGCNGGDQVGCTLYKMGNN